MPSRVVIGLGSNLGSRFALLDAAGDLLADAPGVTVVARARVRETDPLGPPQGRYLNSAVLVETGLDLPALHRVCQSVEAALGRVRSLRWGPRTIDLDLLWSDAGGCRSDSLTVPHPGLEVRAFALDPLLELVGDAAVEGRPLAEVRRAMGEAEGTVVDLAALTSGDFAERLARVSETVGSATVGAKVTVPFVWTRAHEAEWPGALQASSAGASLRLRRAVVTRCDAAEVAGFLLGDSA